MKVSTRPYKGSRDFYPEDKRFQDWMFNKWRAVVERYGYEEYDGPMLERTELYLMKGSSEIVEDQTYTFKDRGDRSVTMRTEMTPTVSRMVAGKRQELAYPARWYSIPDLWRYERTQRGRLREFWQLNVDIFGVANEMAEIEMIQISDDLMQEFGAKRDSYTIKVNSRALVDAALDNFGLNKEKANETVRLVDKINKIPADKFDGALVDIAGDEKAKSIKQMLKAKNTDDLPGELKKLECVKTLKSVIKKCESLGIRNLEFDISLMRGFDYYTDIVFEVFDNDPQNNRAMFGGGRYDGLIGEFGVEPVPTVGFGMGDVTFEDFLRSNKLVPELKSSADAIVLPKDEVELEEARICAEQLREFGLNVSVDYSARKFDKKYKMAVKSGLKFAIYVGDDSEKDVYTIKDLVTGKEQNYSLKRISSIILDTK